MAKRKAKKARMWEGTVLVGIGDRLNSTTPFPSWIKRWFDSGYTRVRITEIIPKSKKSKRAKGTR